jgi:hypothetical protein
MSVDAAGLGSVAFGIVILYAGIKGISVTAALTSIVKGTSPAANPVTNPITVTTQTAAGTTGTATGSGFDVATGIPAGSASYSSASAVEKLWTDNGGPADTAAFAAAIAQAESGGSATVTSSNPDGGTNVGVFQLDTKGVGSGYTVAELQDANLNTQITIMATNGGTNWVEWGDPVSAAVGGHYTPGAPVP